MAALPWHSGAARVTGAGSAAPRGHPVRVAARVTQRASRLAVRARPRRRGIAQGWQGFRAQQVNDVRFLRVAAAVIFQRDGRVLLTQRMPGTPYPGYWEFP